MNESLERANQFTDRIYDATDTYQQQVRLHRGIMTASNASQAAAQVTYDITADVAALIASGEWHGDLFLPAVIGGPVVAAAGAVNFAVQTAG